MLNNLNPRKRWLWVAIGLAGCLAIATPLLQQLGQVDTTQLLDEASQAIAKQDFKRAGELLDNVLALEPQNPAGLIERGKLWASIGKHEEAITDWRHVEVVDGNEMSIKHTSEARWLEGSLQVTLHRATAAQLALTQAWQLRPQVDRLPALELLLRIHVLQMRRQEIRDGLNRIESYRPLSLEEMVLRTDAGAPIIAEVDALPQLRAMIASDPEDLHSVVALARYQMSSENFAEAEQLLLALPPSLAKRSPILGLKALCQFRLGNILAAKQTLQSPPVPNETEYWWWLAAGELAASDNQLPLAADCFGLASQSQPDSGYARYRHGLALHANSQSEPASEQLRIAAKIDQLHQQSDIVLRLVNLSQADFIHGLLQLARTQHELGDSTEATAWARLALQLDANNADARSLSLASAHASARYPITSASATATQQAFLGWLAGDPELVRPPTRSVPEKQPEPLVKIQFEDVHTSAQLDFRYFNGNSGFKYLIESMGGGISVLDFDNDGWPDCYFPQGCKFPFDESDLTYLDQLHRNLDGQRFLNVTSAARLVENRYSQGAATGDLNNDGMVDVIVANFGRNRIFINQGDGTFIDQTDAWGWQESEMSSSLAVADFDRDGNLDVYVVNYVDEVRVCRDSQGNVSTCNPQNFAGVQDRLYQNSGDGRFIDVTQAAGIVTQDGKGLGVVASDFDDDGWVDIYVANDTNANYLFQNLGQMQFQEVGLASGTALSAEGKAQAGMGIAAGDFDGDLRTDLYVTNFYLESNNLYLNLGELNFKDNARAALLSLPSKHVLGFGTQALDIDLDGDLDLIVANGHIDDYSSRGDPWKMSTQLFRNLGKGVFEDCSSSAGRYFQQPQLGRGVATLDWNRDGRSDVIVVPQDGPAALLENQTQTSSQGLAIQLIGADSNRDAIGAKLVIESNGEKIRRDVHGGDGFYSTNERRILVEGRASMQVQVHWPRGKKTQVTLGISQREVVIKEN